MAASVGAAAFDKGQRCCRRFPRQTCELLASPRRRRDFAGPDGSGGGGGRGQPSSPEACAEQSRLVLPVRRLPVAG